MPEIIDIRTVTGPQTAQAARRDCETEARTQAGAR